MPVLQPTPGQGHAIRRAVPHDNDRIFWAEETLAAGVASVATALITASFFFHFVASRLNRVSDWRRLKYIDWVVVLLFVDSWVFSLASSLVQFGSFRLNQSPSACEAAILICETAYVLTKAITFLFLIERVHIIHDGGHKRWTSKLYRFNFVLVAGCYVIWVPLYFIFRVDQLHDGLCIIGIAQDIIIASLAAEVAINLWLTGWFIYPLLKLRTFDGNWKKGIFFSRNNSAQNNSPTARRLYSVTRKTVIGSVAAMGATSVNLILNAVLGSQPAWLCLMLCKFDVFARAVAVHWITKRDRFGSDPEKPLRRKGGHRTSRPARHDADACSKVPGLCCSGLQGSTLLTMSSAAYNGARSRPGGDADEVVHRAHPGELVPGSLYLGRGPASRSSSPSYSMPRSRAAKSPTSSWIAPRRARSCRLVCAPKT